MCATCTRNTLPPSFTLKLEAAAYSETSVTKYQTTRFDIPEDGSVHSSPCENLRFETDASRFAPCVLV